MVAILAANPQKAVLQSAAGKEFVEFTLNMVGQRASLGLKGLFKYG